MAFRFQSAIAGAAKRGSERLATIDETFRENIKLTSAKIAKDVEEVRKERTKSILDYSDKGKNLKRRYGLNDAQVQTILSGGMGAYEDFVEAVKSGQTQAEDPAAFDAKTYSKSLFEGEVTSEGILSLADQAKAYATSRVPSSINVQTEASGIAAATQSPFGGLSTEDVVKRLNVTEDDKDSPTLRSDTGLSIKGVGGLTGAEIASIEQDRKTEARDDERFAMEVTAFGTNQARVKALTQQIANQEERAKRGELNAEEEKIYNRTRDALADAQRKTELEQQAEMFVLNKQAKKLDITAKDLANKKAQEPPQFNDFEEMAVYYAGKLAEEGLTSQQESDYTDLMNNAIEGAKSWNEKTAAKGKAKSPFSPENRTSVFNAAVKKELAPYGLVNDLGLEIATEIEGNEPTYFAGMNRALVALNKQTAALQDAQFNSVIDSAVETLKERVSIYKANPDNNLPDNKQPQSADEAFTPAFTSELEAGDVVRYNTPKGEVSMVWLGTRYYTQPIFKISK